MTLEQRFAELKQAHAVEPPTLAELEHRANRQRRRRRMTAGALGVVAALVLSLGALFASQRTGQSGLSTIDQPTAVPVVTAARLSPGFVPTALRAEKPLSSGSNGIGNYAVQGSRGSIPPESSPPPHAPRSLDGLVYSGSDSGALATLIAVASAQADYPDTFLSGFEDSADWQHVTVGPRTVNVTPDQGRTTPLELVAVFGEHGVLVEVTGTGISREDFLRFVAELRVDATG